MQFDPTNKVAKLCADGMNAEAQGQIETAQQLFREAWLNAANDFEKFTAAHYLARNQNDPQDKLKWNAEALAFAHAIKDDSMKAHFPSLHLNVAKSYEMLGDIENAKQHYLLAAQFSNYLPAGGYGDLIKSGINAGLKRVGLNTFSNPVIDDLINKWCERKDLKPLSLILPAYLGNLGTESDINKLVSALSYLSATQYLNAEEQKKVDELISALSAKQTG